MSGSHERATLRRHNRSAVKAYVTDVREARHKGRAGGEGGSRQAPGSRSPASGQAEALWDDEDNRFAAKLLNPIIEGWLRYERPGSYFIIEEASLQHAAWEDGRTPLDRALNKRLNAAINAIEAELHRRYPGVQIAVNRNPRHKRVTNLYESAGLDRAVAAQADYRIIVARLEQIEQEMPHLTRGQAIEALSNRMRAEAQEGAPEAREMHNGSSTSAGRIRKAIEQVNRANRERAC